MKTDIQQISMFHPNLIAVLLWLEAATGFEYTITSQHRKGDKGVHGTMPLRAVDLRCRAKSVGWTIEHLINTAWAYDPTRPNKSVCLSHGEGANYHLHIQVHTNTHKRHAE